MTKRVSIIGSNSFLAVHLSALLRKENCIVNGFARSNVNPHVSHYYLFNFPEQKPNLEVLLESDVIILAAGNGIQSNLKVDDFKILRLNTFFPIELMTSLSAHGYQGKFISFGSYAEIGVSKLRTPFKEEEIIHSKNIVHNQYTVSKRILTNYINNTLINSYQYYHLILPTIYGKGENPLRLIPYIINCYQNSIIAKLTSGEQVRQYLHVIDACKYIIELINSDDIKEGIYNLGSKAIYSVKDVTDIIRKTLGAKIDVEFGSTTRSDTMMQYIANDQQKISTHIQISNKIKIEEGILSYLENE